MRFPDVKYLEWAKTVPDGVTQIGSSGMPEATPDDLGLADDGSVQLGWHGAYGSPQVRERIAGRYGVTPEQVYPTEGTSLANFLALAALLENGGHAVVESPVYTPLLQQVEALAGGVSLFERVFEHGYGVDPERVGAAIRPDTRVVVLTNLHNPSGARTPDPVLADVAARAGVVGAHVLVDEAYRDFLFDEPPGTAARAAPNVVATSSLTKVYGLGLLRFGWLIGPAEILTRASRINDYLGVLQPSPSVSLGLRALDRLPALTRRSRALLDRSRPILRSWLETRSDCEVVWPEAGPIAFPRLVGLNSRADTTTLSERLLARAGVAVVPGHFFRDPRSMRLSATLPPERLGEGLAALGAELDRL